MVLGLGAGWQINEHVAYGFELEAPGPRVSRFEEAIQITRSLLDEDNTSFEGEFYTMKNAPSTARHAQEWNAWGGPEMAGRARATWNEACEKVGTDPASYRTSVQALIHMTDDADKAAAIRDGDMGERSIAGTNDQIVDELGQLAALGFNELIVPDFTLGNTMEQRREAYERFAADIAPQLR